jgi:hypothetical protein
MPESVVAVRFSKRLVRIIAARRCLKLALDYLTADPPTHETHVMAIEPLRCILDNLDWLERRQRGLSN